VGTCRKAEKSLSGWGNAVSQGRIAEPGKGRVKEDWVGSGGRRVDNADGERAFRRCISNQISVKGGVNHINEKRKSVTGQALEQGAGRRGARVQVGRPPGSGLKKREDGKFPQTRLLMGNQ